MFVPEKLQRQERRDNDNDARTLYPFAESGSSRYMPLIFSADLMSCLIAGIAV